MASNNKSNNLEQNNKKKKNKNKKNEVAEAKKTPVKKPPQKSPIAKTPSQVKDKKKKKKTTTGNGRESLGFTVISSSSCDSQSHDIQPPRSQPKNHTSKSSKPDKNNKRKQNDEDEGDGTMFKFPMARIKRIIKSEDPTLQLPQDVVFLVNKATEKFIEQFCEEAYDCSVQDRKKALAYKHLSSVVSKSKRFDFLSDYVPGKLKAEAALEQRKLVENGET